MKRLSNEQVMDYLDASLSSDEMARIEAHLKINAEDAELVRDIQNSLSLVHEVRDSETLRVSDNFWPTLRDNLGPAPKRSAWNLFKNRLAGAFGPSKATRLSFGAAFALIVLTLGALLFAPQNATHQAVALTDADRTFINQSVQKHEAYVQSQPSPGDASSLESGADDDNEKDIP